MDNLNKCSCKLCERSKVFKKHLDTIDNKEAKEWFEDFMGYVYELEEDFDCYRIYNENLKTLYPKIWKETRTVETLSKDNAQFPKRQI